MGVYQRKIPPGPPACSYYAFIALLLEEPDVAFRAKCGGRDVIIVLEAKRFEKPFALDTSMRQMGFRGKKQRSALRLISVATELGMSLSNLYTELGIRYHCFAYLSKRFRCRDKLRGCEAKLREAVLNALGLTEKYVTILKVEVGEKAAKETEKELQKFLRKYGCEPL